MVERDELLLLVIQSIHPVHDRGGGISRTSCNGQVGGLEFVCGPSTAKRTSRSRNRSISRPMGCSGCGWVSTFGNVAGAVHEATRDRGAQQNEANRLSMDRRASPEAGYAMVFD